jgi:hypothetical protein
MINIINEEVKKFINEARIFESGDLKFRSKVEKPRFYNYEGFSNDYDIDIPEAEIYITWHIGFWLNESGIENFIIYIDGIDGNYKVNMYDKHTDKLTQESSKEINEVNWNYKIDTADLEYKGTLYLESADFDFKTKECLVDFK